MKKHDDPDLVVLATDECLFADEGFRWLHLPSFYHTYPMKSSVSYERTEYCVVSMLVSLQHRPHPCVHLVS